MDPTGQVPRNGRHAVRREGVRRAQVVTTTSWGGWAAFLPARQCQRRCARRLEHQAVDAGAPDEGRHVDGLPGAGGDGAGRAELGADRRGGLVGIGEAGLSPCRVADRVGIEAERLRARRPDPKRRALHRAGDAARIESDVAAHIGGAIDPQGDLPEVRRRRRRIHLGVGHRRQRRRRGTPGRRGDRDRIGRRRVAGRVERRHDVGVRRARREPGLRERHVSGRRLRHRADHRAATRDVVARDRHVVRRPRPAQRDGRRGRRHRDDRFRRRSGVGRRGGRRHAPGRRVGVIPGRIERRHHVAVRGRRCQARVRERRIARRRLQTEPTFVPSRLTSYRVTATSSVDRVHEIVAVDDVVAVAAGVPGADGGVVSAGGGAVVTLPAAESV